MAGAFCAAPMESFWMAGSASAFGAGCRSGADLPVAIVNGTSSDLKAEMGKEVILVGRVILAGMVTSQKVLVVDAFVAVNHPEGVAPQIRGLKQVTVRGRPSLMPS